MNKLLIVLVLAVLSSSLAWMPMIPKVSITTIITTTIVANITAANLYHYNLLLLMLSLSSA